MSKQFEATIKTQDYEKVSLSNYEEDLWMSVWGTRSHISIQLNREQVAELRDALNAFLSQE
jgi:predicted membrane chloride channel (bestrophin family)